MLPIIRSNFDQNWLPSMFNDFFDNTWMPKASATAPSFNVLETEKEYRVEVAAPGMSKDDFKLQIDADENLVIMMERKSEENAKQNEGKKENCRYLRKEFSYSKYTQTLILPDDVKKQEISAVMKDGILTVTLPKVMKEDQEKRVRQILIN